MKDNMKISKSNGKKCRLKGKNCNRRHLGRKRISYGAGGSVRHYSD